MVKSYTRKRCSMGKDGGLIRQLHDTRAQFFASYSHFERVHSTAAEPLPTALYTTEKEG